MKLYYSITSPYVRKVMICAHEKGLAEGIELIEAGGVAASNPLAKVPTLIDEGGECIYDSLVICDYLDNLEGAAALIPPDAAARNRVLRAHALANGVMDAAVASVMESRRPEGKIWEDARVKQHGKISRALDVMDAGAAGFGDRVDLETISAAAAIGYIEFRLGEMDWLASRGALARWYQAFSKRPSMAATAPPG